MEMVLILVQQILVMVAMMLVGVALIRAKMIDESGVKQMSNVAMYVATPAVIIQAFAIDYNPEQLVNGLWVAATGFVGIPIISSLLGPQYVFYVTMTMAVGTFVLWTYGIYLMSGDMSQISFAKIVTNPAVIALAVGLVLFFAPVHLPAMATSVLTGLGNLNTGLGMLVLGANLGISNIGLMISDVRLYKASALRLLLVPALVTATLFLMPCPFEIKMTVLICEATPCGAVTSMLAQIYGSDYQYGTGLVIMTTLLSMATMPLVLSLAMNVL